MSILEVAADMVLFEAKNEALVLMQEHLLNCFKMSLFEF